MFSYSLFSISLYSGKNLEYLGIIRSTLHIVKFRTVASCGQQHISVSSTSYPCGLYCLFHKGIKKGTKYNSSSLSNVQPTIRIQIFKSAGCSLFDLCCCDQLNFRGWLQTEIANLQKLKKISQATTKPDCRDLFTMDLNSTVSSHMNSRKQ